MAKIVKLNLAALLAWREDLRYSVQGLPWRVPLIEED